VGYVIIRALGHDVLWGDSFGLDPMRDYFQGETLATLNDDLEAECSRHAIRFSNREELFEGTKLIVWTGRAFQPSPTTEPIGPKVQLVTAIYDEAGNHVSNCARELIAVQVSMRVRSQTCRRSVGWTCSSTRPRSWRRSCTPSVRPAQLHAWCLPAELSFEGPTSASRNTSISSTRTRHPAHRWRSAARCSSTIT
jgi:hypothetical protein